jgi:FkbM family methyltransferase
MKKTTIIEICAGATLFAFIGLFNAQIVGAALVVLGRSPKCPWSAALASVSTFKKQNNLTEYIMAHSKVIEKDELGTELWDTPSGKYWLPQGSAKAIAYDLAEQQRDIYGFNGHGVRAGDTVLDCGANIGVYTRRALNAGAQKVIAIEPAPENLRCLRKTFANEIAAGKVVIYPKGVWDKDDVLPMNVDPANSARDTFVGELEGLHKVVNLPLTTIDKLIEELKLDRVDYIKFDIEGAERRAIAGGARTIAKYHPRMAICVYHLSDDPDVIPAAVKKAWNGYHRECGPCVVGEENIKPEVFFFY